MSRRRRRRSRRGLTLVELIVVLIILVMLAGVAVTNTEGLVEQARFDASRRGLEEVEGAVLGPPNLVRPDGTPWVRGFVADVGRLPRVVGADPATQLNELWVQPGGVPASSVQTPAGDAEVRVPGGWRGPYLRLSLGATGLLDGWGQPLQALKADETAAAAGDEVTIARTLGADNAAGGTGYDEDLAVVVHRTTAPAVGPRHQGDLPVRVTPSTAPGAGARVVVRIYGPVDGQVRTIAQQVFLSSAGTTTFTFAAVSIGPRVLRAYQTDEDPTATPEAPVTVASHRTSAVALAVVAGALPELQLTLQ